MDKRKQVQRLWKDIGRLEYFIDEIVSLLSSEYDINMNKAYAIESMRTYLNSYINFARKLEKEIENAASG